MFQIIDNIAITDYSSLKELSFWQWMVSTGQRFKIKNQSDLGSLKAVDIEQRSDYTLIIGPNGPCVFGDVMCERVIS